MTLEAGNVAVQHRHRHNRRNHGGGRHYDGEERDATHLTMVVRLVVEQNLLFLLIHRWG